MAERRDDVTVALAEWLAALSFDDLPADLIEQAEGTLIDYLGCALAGSQRTHARQATELALEMGGEPQATVLGTSTRTSVDRAAFLNGTFGSSTPQFDDVCKESLGHPGVGTHPAVLAVGEQQGATGREALVAIVAGFEMSWRIGAGIGLPAFNKGWHPRGGVNVFAAAAAAAKLLGLSGTGTYCAVLGLAGNQAAGLMAATYWHDAWYLLSGHASQNGVLAALLAERGYGAGRTIIEDDYGGYGNVVSDGTDFERMLEGLGERYELPFTGQKPHSSSGATHAAIDAVLRLRADHDLTPGDVDKIEVRTYQVAAGTLGRKFPTTHLHGTMSVPYLVARALLDGQVQLEQFTDEKLQDPEVRLLQERVEMIVDPELDQLAPKYLPASVTVYLHDGTSLTETVTIPKGDPENPMTRDELDDKFRLLASGVLEEAAIEETIAIVRDLGALDDLRDLTQVLRRTAGQP